MSAQTRRMLTDDERSAVMSVGPAVRWHGPDSPEAKAARIAAQKARVERERKRLRELIEGAE